MITTPQPRTYDAATDVKRTNPGDDSAVQHVTTAWLQRLGAREKNAGHRQGQRDLLADAGFDTTEDLLAFLDEVDPDPDGDA